VRHRLEKKRSLSYVQAAFSRNRLTNSPTHPTASQAPSTTQPSEANREFPYSNVVEFLRAVCLSLWHLLAPWVDFFFVVVVRSVLLCDSCSLVSERKMADTGECASAALVPPLQTPREARVRAATILRGLYFFLSL
jgi:hypothetical protein